MFDSVTYSNVSEAVISRAVNGIGINGICKTSFSFKIPLSDYAGAVSKAPQCNIIAFERINGEDVPLHFPTFYVDSRVSDGTSLTVTCFDRVALCDGFWWDDVIEDETIGVTDVLNRIAQVVGLGEVKASGIFETALPRAVVEGKSYTEILSTIADLNLGFFSLDNEGNLVFRGYSELNGFCAFEDNSKIIELGAVGIDGYRVEYSGNVYSEGGGYKITPSAANVVDIERYVGNVRGHSTHEYKMWSIENCRVHEIPLLNSYFELNICNNISVRITGGGMFAKLSRNAVQISEISDYFCVRNRDRREQSAKIGSGQMCGSMYLSNRYGQVYKTNG